MSYAKEISKAILFSSRFFKKICSLLIQKGANGKSTTPEGNTPLHYLVSRQIPQQEIKLAQEVIGDLLSSGADVNTPTTTNQETALHYATQREALHITSFLLECGANPNLNNKRGYTPLHISIACGNYELVKVMLQYQANPSLQCREGSGIAMARAAKDPKILQVIEQALRGNLEYRKSKIRSVDHIPAYFRDIPREAAANVVGSWKRDCFLVRNSATPECYAITAYKKEKNLITHWRVNPVEGGYIIEAPNETKNVYASVSELLKNSSIFQGCAPRDLKSIVQQVSAILPLTNQTMDPKLKNELRISIKNLNTVLSCI